MKEYSQHIIDHKNTVEQSLERLNQLSENLLLFIVDDKNVLVGTLTDGDIRRGILKGIKLTDEVSRIMHKGFRFIRNNQYSLEQLDNFRKSQLRLIPVLNENNEIIRIVDLSRKRSILPLTVIMMAGGRGERLRPMTDELPKPLLKVGGKPIIEYNIDRLASFGVDVIEVAVNYLGHMIRDYLGDGTSKGIRIRYINEKEPMGTIGAVSMSQVEHSDVLLLMNADLLTDIDYEDFYKSFIESGCDMAVASIPYKQEIPYAVLEVENDKVVALKEKPTYTYYSNAGIYLIRKELLSLIPRNEFYNATDLMEKVIAEGYKLTYYPIRSYWLDIGKPYDFDKAQDDIRHIHI